MQFGNCNESDFCRINYFMCQDSVILKREVQDIKEILEILGRHPVICLLGSTVRSGARVRKLLMKVICRVPPAQTGIIDCFYMSNETGAHNRNVSKIK